MVEKLYGKLINKIELLFYLLKKVSYHFLNCKRDNLLFLPNKSAYIIFIKGNHNKIQ